MNKEALYLEFIEDLKRWCRRLGPDLMTDAIKHRIEELEKDLNKLDES